MAENIILAQVLAGISALQRREDLDEVKTAVKARLAQLGEEVDPFAEGNSDEMISVNKETFDYSNVPKKDLLMAERWNMARRPSWRSRSAYYQWRVWNVAKTIEGKDLKGYKGNLIIEKATGRSTEGEQEDIEFDEGEEEDDEEVREATEAMAGVRVE